MEKMTLKAGALETDGEQSANSAKPSLETKNNKLKIGIAVLVAGLVILVAGIVFLATTLMQGPKTQDAEYLVSAGSWQREDEPGVVWNFTEIGKGVLTTDDHAHDYDFIWAIEGNTLKIETEWLYTLNDEYVYAIEDNKLVLDDSIVFLPIMSD